MEMLVMSKTQLIFVIPSMYQRRQHHPALPPATPPPGVFQHHILACAYIVKDTTQMLWLSG